MLLIVKDLSMENCPILTAKSCDISSLTVPEKAIEKSEIIGYVSILQRLSSLSHHCKAGWHAPCI
jgi:hypothetical protein